VLAQLARWLAGVTGAARPHVRARVVVVGGASARLRGLAAEVGAELSRVDADTAGGLDVPAVAAAVDQGRELAASAARDGITLVTGIAEREDIAHAVALVAGLASGPPLRALRRFGDGELCVLAGLALGAGEQGLGYVCDGLASTVAAAVAVGVEPDLRPRLLAGHRSTEPAHAAMLEHLGLEPVLDLGLRAGGGVVALGVLGIAARVA
jgi:nicotinate-nucleotide--dimethylbenzimidazole phosphoribosyltransferase